MKATWLLALVAFASSPLAQCAFVELSSIDATEQDNFGGSVALGHDFIAIGAQYHDLPATNTGAVYVYVEDASGGWVQVDKLHKEQTSSYQFFGRSVAVDGDTIVVGDNDQSANRGAVWVYERDDAGTPETPLDDTWVETASVVASDGDFGDNFGWSVDLDADVLMVGAIDADPTTYNSGAVYFFHRDDPGTPQDAFDDTWVEVSKLTAPDPDASLYFGILVATDKTTALVPTLYHDGPDENTGTAYVFERHLSGTPQDPFDDTWILIDQLFPIDPAAHNQFGSAGDLGGRTIAVGARRQAGLSGPEAGRVYVYQRDDHGTPQNRFDDTFELLDLLQSVHPETSRFGESVAVDVHDLLIGAPLDSTSGELAGAAYVFRRDDKDTPEDSLDDTWSQVDHLTPTHPQYYDYFGAEVALAHGRIVVGAEKLALPPDIDPGRVFVYPIEDTDPLVGSPSSLSASAGGQADFTLDVSGCTFAGELYLLLGSASGSAPGFTLGGFSLLLNPDVYFLASVNGANGTIFVNTFGVLDADGDASAALVLPPGLGALAGLTLDHAFVVLESGTSAVRLVSNTEPVALTP